MDEPEQEKEFECTQVFFNSSKALDVQTPVNLAGLRNSGGSCRLFGREHDDDEDQSPDHESTHGHIGSASAVGAVLLGGAAAERLQHGIQSAAYLSGLCLIGRRTSGLIEAGIELCETAK